MFANQIIPEPVPEPTPPSVCSPSAYTIHINGNNPSPAFFPGSAVGTTVMIGPGEYSVTEEIPRSPYFPSPNIRTHSSPDCNGAISVGESKTCVITNAVGVPITPLSA